MKKTILLVGLGIIVFGFGVYVAINDDIDWRVINSFALWISATGTWFAAWTALRLARKDATPLLVLEADFGSKYPQFDEESKDIVILVTNIGRRPIRVTGLFWKAYSFSFEDHPIVLDKTDAKRLKKSDRIPITLSEGNSFEFRFDPENFGRDFIETRVPKWEAFLAIRSLKIIAESASNIYWEARPGKALRKYLIYKYFGITDKLLMWFI